MDIRQNPLLIPYESVEEAQVVADCLGISYQIVRYENQACVWIVPITITGVTR